MAIDLHPVSERSLTGLVTGILSDAQELITQQLALFRHEIQDDLRRTKEAALSLVLGLGIALLGAIVLSLMLVHLLNWSWPQLPLWSCYGIVGGVLSAVGAALCFASKKQFDSFNPLPEQSVQALRENVQWITKPN